MPSATIDELQHLYTAHAFLEEDVGCSEAETGATTLWGNLLTRTYESPFKWYFVVFKPFNRAYERDPAYFKHKGLSKCRDLFKRPEAILLTKETQATKVHVNALVCTSQDLLSKHQSAYCNKYKLHVSKLEQPTDRHRVLDYITKESLSRTFELYRDYIYYIPQRNI